MDHRSNGRRSQPRTRDAVRGDVRGHSLGGLTLGACGDDDDEHARTGTTRLHRRASRSRRHRRSCRPKQGNFGVLLAAATSAGLVDELQGDRRRSPVFAPTDGPRSRRRLDELGFDAGRAARNTETLGRSCCITWWTERCPPRSMVMLDGEQVETLNGDRSPSGCGYDVTLNDSVNVVATDVEASNGVIHVINGVLLPRRADRRPAGSRTGVGARPARRCGEPCARRSGHGPATSRTSRRGPAGRRRVARPLVRGGRRSSARCTTRATRGPAGASGPGELTRKSVANRQKSSVSPDRGGRSGRGGARHHRTACR